MIRDSVCVCWIFLLKAYKKTLVFGPSLAFQGKLEEKQEPERINSRTNQTYGPGHLEKT